MKFVFNVNTEAALLESFALRICEAGSNNRDVFGGTYEGGYQIQQNPVELAALVRCLAFRAPYKNSLDIGLGAGGTTRIIREMIEVGTTTIVDDGAHPTFSVWEENKKFVPNLTEIFGNSQHNETVARVRALGRKFDLVMIDADHAYASVKADLENYQEFFADGAVVWFHDTVACSGEVGRLWEEVKDEGHRVLLDTGTYLGIGAVAWNVQLAAAKRLQPIPR